MNKHRVVEIKLASLTTGDCLLPARQLLSPAMLVVAETGASLTFQPSQPWLMLVVAETGASLAFQPSQPWLMLVVAETGASLAFQPSQPWFKE